MLGGWDSRRPRSNKGGRLSQSQCVCSAAASWVFHDHAVYARRLEQPPSRAKKTAIVPIAVRMLGGASLGFHNHAVYAWRLRQPPSRAKKSPDESGL